MRSPPNIHTVMTRAEWIRDIEATAAARERAAQALASLDKYKMVTTPPVVVAPPVVPKQDKLFVRHIKAKRVPGSDTFQRRGGTMHGTTSVVTSGNGIGTVPAAYYPAAQSNAEWLAVKYR